MSATVSEQLEQLKQDLDRQSKRVAELEVLVNDLEYEVRKLRRDVRA